MCIIDVYIYNAYEKVALHTYNTVMSLYCNY